MKKTHCFTINLPKNNTGLHRSSPSQRRIPLLLSIFLLLASLNLACNFDLSLLTRVQTTPTPTISKPEEQIPRTMVTFNVQVPAITPAGEPIMLNILDEVTGLAINVESYQMEVSNDLNYTISIPLPISSIVKYRYSRQGYYDAHEFTTNQQPIRYRLYHVEAPSEIFDIVSSWGDTVYQGEVGRIVGRAIDNTTAAPLPNLLITAGGIHAFTSADGTFLIEGLSPGTHNLVSYALDGTYNTSQQGATIAPNSTTPAPLRLNKSPMVNVVFTVTLPENTMPAVPIRLAGNLSQLGNTFADLSGGVNTLSARMPTLSPLPDGRYSLALSLPVGAYIQYKYSLGDGYWNSEHDLEGNFRLRQLIVPDSTLIIEDVVDTWSDQKGGAIMFDLTVPDNTPPEDYISIQFNPYGWTEPISMWRLSDQRWVFILYSPFDKLENFGYRYCRSDQCNSADDALTPGSDSFGRIVHPTDELQTIVDTVDDWMWLDPLPTPVTITSPEIRVRKDGFIAGIEFHPYYHASWPARLPVAFKDVYDLGANMVVLSPSYTYTRSSFPLLEPVSGIDPLWFDVITMVEMANNYGLNVALKPIARFPMPVDDWWRSAPRDFSWWHSWFERYSQFILNFATLAEHQGVDAFILGGNWITPALPDGRLSNLAPSDVPDDFEDQWRELISKVRSTYSGRLVWAMSVEMGISKPPVFLDEMDEVYLLWSVPLADEPGSSEADLHMRAADILDKEIKEFQRELNKPVSIGLSYPSAEGSSTVCLPDPLAILDNTCLDIDLLSPPNPDIPSIKLDLEEQALIYNALLVAINERDFISGFISRGYYPPVALKDKSVSIHGKPASAILEHWFPRMLGLVSP